MIAQNMVPVKDSNCCCAKISFCIACLICVLVLIPTVTWYKVNEQCENSSTWKDICGYGSVVFAPNFTCVCDSCYARKDGRCEYQRKYYALAAVLQTIPLPGLFGAGYAYLELWTYFIFQCSVTCLAILILCALMSTNMQPDAHAMEGIFAAGLLGSVSVLWWLISLCMMWSNYYSDANGIALYK